MRVLVVEDEKQISDLLKTALAAESFAVDVAEDGEQGSFMALTNDYDLVILDIGLPKLNGLEVCKRIRQGGKTASIIMLSVQSGVDTKVKFFNAGADDYITKPFSLEELMARVRAVMRRQTTLQGDVL